jgi:hypothetical protein
LQPDKPDRTGFRREPLRIADAEAQMTSDRPRFLPPGWVLLDNAIESVGRRLIPDWQETDGDSLRQWSVVFNPASERHNAKVRAAGRRGRFNVSRFKPPPRSAPLAAALSRRAAAFHKLREQCGYGGVPSAVLRADCLIGPALPLKNWIDEEIAGSMYRTGHATVRIQSSPLESSAVSGWVLIDEARLVLALSPQSTEATDGAIAPEPKLHSAEPERPRGVSEGSWATYRAATKLDIDLDQRGGVTQAARTLARNRGKPREQFESERRAITRVRAELRKQK